MGAHFLFVCTNFNFFRQEYDIQLKDERLLSIPSYILRTSSFSAHRMIFSLFFILLRKHRRELFIQWVVGVRESAASFFSGQSRLLISRSIFGPPAVQHLTRLIVLDQCKPVKEEEEERKEERKEEKLEKERKTDFLVSLSDFTTFHYTSVKNVSVDCDMLANDNTAHRWKRYSENRQKQYARQRRSSIQLV